MFPIWSKISEYRKSITPTPVKLPEPFDGYKMELVPAIEMTLSQILLSMGINSLPCALFKLKAGVDGSGNHKIFHQSNSADTNNMILTMFAPLSLEDKTTGRVIWESPNPNSADVHRPLVIQTGKETRENMMTLKTISSDMLKVELEGLVMPQVMQPVDVKIDISCIDRKAADNLQGTLGAFCDLCEFNRLECQNSDNFDNMLITRNVDTSQAIFDMLVDENGEIKKSKNDYKIRQGVTKEPIVQKNIMSIQPLHGRLRGLDFHIKLITHLKAGRDPLNTNFWSESKNLEDMDQIKAAKRDIQMSLKDHAGGIRLDFPDGVGCSGTTTTGNIARRLFNDDKHGSRDQLLLNVPEPHREKCKSILERHGIVLNVINSTEKLKDVMYFKEYCQSLYRDILEWFPNAVITPTVHKILSHSWELIQHNDDYGLGKYSEEGLEGCNKILRRIRTTLSRKTSKDANQIDCLQRLWAKSDPICNKIRRDILPYCSICQKKVHGTRYCTSKSLIRNASFDIFFS